MYKWGIGCMLIFLVIVLAMQYYMLEGFDVPPAPVASGLAAAGTGMPVAAELPDAPRLPAMPVPDMPADDVNDASGGAAPLAAAKQELAKMLQDFQQMAKVKTTGERMFTPLPGETANATPALQQGTEYGSNCPDMSQYVRKDAIPCWNCTLDY